MPEVPAHKEVKSPVTGKEKPPEAIVSFMITDAQKKVEGNFQTVDGVANRALEAGVDPGVVEIRKESAWGRLGGVLDELRVLRKEATTALHEAKIRRILEKNGVKDIEEGMRIIHYLEGNIKRSKTREYVIREDRVDAFVDQKKEEGFEVVVGSVYGDTKAQTHEEVEVKKMVDYEFETQDISVIKLLTELDHDPVEVLKGLAGITDELDFSRLNWSEMQDALVTLDKMPGFLTALTRLSQIENLVRTKNCPDFKVYRHQARDWEIGYYCEAGQHLLYRLASLTPEEVKHRLRPEMISRIDRICELTKGKTSPNFKEFDTLLEIVQDEKVASLAIDLAEREKLPFYSWDRRLPRLIWMRESELFPLLAELTDKGFAIDSPALTDSQRYTREEFLEAFAKDFDKDELEKASRDRQFQENAQIASEILGINVKPEYTNLAGNPAFFVTVSPEDLRKAAVFVRDAGINFGTTDIYRDFETLKKAFSGFTLEEVEKLILSEEIDYSFLEPRGFVGFTMRKELLLKAGATGSVEKAKAVLDFFASERVKNLVEDRTLYESLGLNKEKFVRALFAFRDKPIEQIEALEKIAASSEKYKAIANKFLDNNLFLELDDFTSVTKLLDLNSQEQDELVATCVQFGASTWVKSAVLENALVLAPKREELVALRDDLEDKLGVRIVGRELLNNAAKLENLLSSGKITEIVETVQVLRDNFGYYFRPEQLGEVVNWTGQEDLIALAVKVSTRCGYHGFSLNDFHVFEDMAGVANQDELIERLVTLKDKTGYYFNPKHWEDLKVIVSDEKVFQIAIRLSEEAGSTFCPADQEALVKLSQNPNQDAIIDFITKLSQAEIYRFRGDHYEAIEKAFHNEEFLDRVTAFKEAFPVSFQLRSTEDFEEILKIESDEVFQRSMKIATFLSKTVSGYALKPANLNEILEIAQDDDWQSRLKRKLLDQLKDEALPGLVSEIADRQSEAYEFFRSIFHGEEREYFFYELLRDLAPAYFPEEKGELLADLFNKEAPSPEELFGQLEEHIGATGNEAAETLLILMFGEQTGWQRGRLFDQLRKKAGLSVEAEAFIDQQLGYDLSADDTDYFGENAPQDLLERISTRNKEGKKRAEAFKAWLEKRGISQELMTTISEAEQVLRRLARGEEAEVLVAKIEDVVTRDHLLEVGDRLRTFDLESTGTFQVYNQKSEKMRTISRFADLLERRLISLYQASLTDLIEGGNLTQEALFQLTRETADTLNEALEIYQKTENLIAPSVAEFTRLLNEDIFGKGIWFSGRDGVPLFAAAAAVHYGRPLGELRKYEEMVRPFLSNHPNMQRRMIRTALVDQGLTKAEMIQSMRELSPESAEFNDLLEEGIDIYLSRESSLYDLVKLVQLSRPLVQEEDAELTGKFVKQRGVTMNQVGVDTGYHGSVIKKALEIAFLEETEGVDWNQTVRLISGTHVVPRILTAEQGSGGVVVAIEQLPKATDRYHRLVALSDGKLQGVAYPRDHRMKFLAWVGNYACWRAILQKKARATLEGCTYQRDLKPEAYHLSQLEVWEDGKGKERVVKYIENPWMAKEEFLSMRIFQEMGLPVPKHHLERVKGQEVLVTEHLKKLETPKQGQDLPEALDEDVRLMAGLFGDLLLNYYDRYPWNVMYDEKKQRKEVAFIDFGGSFFHTPSGRIKGILPEVTEKDVHLCLRSFYEEGREVNRAYANLIKLGENYGEIEIVDKGKAVQLVRLLSILADPVIDGLVDEAGFDNQAFKGQFDAWMGEAEALITRYKDQPEHRYYQNATQAKEALEIIRDEYDYDLNAYLKLVLKKRRDGILNLFVSK